MSLEELKIIASRIKVDGTSNETVSQPVFFKPFPAREFKAPPAYGLDTEFPQYRDRDDHVNSDYETSCYL